MKTVLLRILAGLMLILIGLVMFVVGWLFNEDRWRLFYSDSSSPSVLPR